MCPDMCYMNTRFFISFCAFSVCVHTTLCLYVPPNEKGTLYCCSLQKSNQKTLVQRTPAPISKSIISACLDPWAMVMYIERYMIYHIYHSVCRALIFSPKSLCCPPLFTTWEFICKVRSASIFLVDTKHRSTEKPFQLRLGH